MTVADLARWALQFLVYGLQAALLYAGVRLFRLSGGLVLNPFQPGWGRLEQLYASAAAQPGMDAGSARIGMVSYRNTICIGFDAQELVLQKTWFGKSLLRIPYSRITCAMAPRRETILRIPIQLDGLFVVDGVSICLKADLARQLLARLTPQPAPLPQP